MFCFFKFIIITILPGVLLYEKLNYHKNSQKLNPTMATLKCSLALKSWASVVFFYEMKFWPSHCFVKTVHTSPAHLTCKHLKGAMGGVSFCELLGLGTLKCPIFFAEKANKDLGWGVKPSARAYRAIPFSSTYALTCSKNC